MINCLFYLVFDYRRTRLTPLPYGGAWANMPKGEVQHRQLPKPDRSVRMQPLGNSWNKRPSPDSGQSVWRGRVGSDFSISMTGITDFNL